MARVPVSLCIFTTILGIGAAARLVSLSNTEREIEKTSSSSVNITNPENTSAGDGIKFVTSSRDTELDITGDYYDQTEEEENGIFSFQDPSARNKLVRMTVKEINKIFNTRGFLRNKNRRLTKKDKRKARECRRRSELFFRKTKSCHPPVEQGPCKDPTKWIVAIRGRLDGVCRERPCLDEATPILYNGTCVSIDNDDCPRYSRLYLNKRGEGYCDCREGFSQHSGSCHRDHLPGPCSNSTVLVSGQCQADPCPQGRMVWRDGECHLASSSLSSCEGDLHLEPESQTVSCLPPPGRGRAILSGSSRSCRSGMVWSSWRGSCVRLFG